MFRLYIANWLGRFYPNSWWKNKNKFKNMYKEGEKRIQELLDISILVKTLR